MTDSQLPPTNPPASSPGPAQPTYAPTVAQGVTPGDAAVPGAEGPIVANASAMGKNPIGLIAFIAAVIGFIFACIPGALIVGWILLPVAFILAIVGLVLSGKRKALAIAALIISVVGTIVAVVVFFAVVASSFEDAFGGGDSTVAPPPSSSESDEETTPDEVAVAESGTRDNPAAIGSTITGTEYTIVVNSVVLNATDQVLAANQFNEVPPEGSAYLLINATVTYTGVDSGFADFASFDYVTSGGQVVTSLDSFAVPPEPQLSGELFTGASATGNQVLAVPVGDAGVLRVRPGIAADEVFIALQ